MLLLAGRQVVKALDFFDMLKMQNHHAQNFNGSFRRGMAPAVKISSARPSLQALLCLEKEHSAFDEQLQQAARIVGLPDDWWNEHGILETTHQPDVSFDPRAEWVLRWLLDKLKARDESGQHARQNVNAWMLLDKVVLRAPAVNASKLLNAAGFLSLLEKALEETLEASQGFSRSAVPERSLDATSQDGGKKKKRKRLGTPNGEDRTSKKSRHSSIDPTPLLEVMANVLDSIVHRSRKASNAADPFVVVRMLSVLQTSRSEAAHLLSLWIKLLEASLRATSQLPAYISKRQTGQSSMLGLILEVWKHHQSDEAGENISLAFSRECLVGTVSLYARLLRMNNLQQDLSSQMAHTTMELQTLLASHIFVPAREQYFRSDSETRSAPDLEHFLEPFSLKIGSLQRDSSLDIDSQELEIFIQTIPSLFGISIACTPRDTPRKRIGAAPWFETVFKSLANTMSCPVPKADTSSIHPQAIQLLTEMLQLARKEDVSLSSSVLEAIVRDYTGIYHDNSKQIIWSLILSAMELDRDLFLPRRKLSISNNEEIETTSIADRLFSKLSECWLDGSPSDDVATQTREITRKLMQDYSYGRDLPGFIHRWHSEILKFVAADASNHAVKSSPWTGYALLAPELRLHLINSVSQSQINSLLEEYGSDIVDLSSQDKTAKPQKVRASFIVVDALLGAINSEGYTIGTETGNCLEKLYQAIMTALKNHKNKVAQSTEAAWRILNRLFDLLWPGNISKRPDLESQIGSVLEFAVQSQAPVLVSEDGLDTGVRAEMLAYLVRVLTTFAPYGVLGKDSAKDLIKSTAILCKPSAPNKPSKKRGKKDQANSSVGSLEPYHFRLSQISLQFLDLIDIIPEKPRQAFFENLFWDAYKANGQENVESPQALDMLHAYVDIALLSTTPAVRDSMLSALSIGFEQDLTKVKLDLFAFSEDVFLRIPARAIPRKRREQIVDSVVDCVKSTDPSKAQSNVMNKHLALMIRLMQVPNATAKIMNCHSNGESELEQIIKILGEPSPDGAQLGDFQAMAALVRLVVSHAMPAIDQACNKELLRSLYARPDTPKFTILENTSRLVINQVTLDEMKGYGNRILLFLDEQSASSRRDAYLKTLLASLKETSKLSQDSVGNYAVGNLNVLLSALACYPFPKETDDSIETVRAQLSRYSKISRTKHLRSLFHADSPFSTVENWVWFHKAVGRFLINRPDEYLKLSELILRHEDLSPKYYSEVLSTIRRDFSSSETAEKKRLAASLLGTPSAAPSVQALRILVELVSTIRNETTYSSETTSDHQYPFLLSGLCNLLQTSPSAQYLHSVLDCISLALKEKPFLVSQYVVDTLFSSISTVMSQWVSTPHNGSIYLRLCGVAHTLISLHRTKLGGRYHLVASTLQVLLALLFTPDSANNGLFNQSVDGDKANTIGKVSKLHAATYANVLSTLCSPTVSSASAGGRRGAHSQATDLIDPTKKAKAYAGEYVRFVLMEYVNRTLKGRLASEGMKEALLPGLWAAMEACGEEGLRNISVGLDASGRAVWRGLVSEWRRGRGGER